MQKTKTQKIQQWTTANIVLNVVTYLLNAVVIVMLFYLSIYLNGLKGAINVSEYFKDVTAFLHFILSLVLILAAMVLYFFFEDRDFLKRPINSEMMFLIIELFLAVCYAAGTYVDIYLRPVALATILTLFLTDRKKAVFMNIIYCILIFLFDSFGEVEFSIGNYPVIVMSFSSGIITCFCLDKVYSRLRLLAMSLLISLPTLACVAMTVIEVGSENIVVSLVCGAASGPLAVALFMVLLPVFEMTFKKVSYFKYYELTAHKSKLIKKLIQQAPGTFNHSIVVSNIAEACAAAIDEDALLARTCAYYHDIGKLRRPEFFKENQADGINPHDDLTPELSANIIKSHAFDGYKLVQKNRLPQEIADVCVEHHGTLPILYFYDKARKFTDGDVDLQQYCYPGPKPTTKIAAIIMIADGCEAAARSLQDRSRDNVKKVVRKIVNDRLALGQFDDCEITLKELNIIIHTVVNNLTGIYHSRIEYPKVSLDGVDLN